MLHAFRHDDESHLLGEEIEPLLPSDGQHNARSGSALAQNGDHEQICEQLRVRSRLFSTSEDALLGAHPQVGLYSPGICEGSTSQSLRPYLQYLARVGPEFGATRSGFVWWR